MIECSISIECSTDEGYIYDVGCGCCIKARGRESHFRSRAYSNYSNCIAHLDSIKILSTNTRLIHFQGHRHNSFRVDEYICKSLNCVDNAQRQTQNSDSAQQEHLRYCLYNTHAMKIMSLNS